MAEVGDKLWTLEEFLAFDDGTDTSYQLFEGRIVAMNPPLRGHAALVARLIRIAGNQLKPPCEVYAEAGIIPVNRRHSWYKADLIVTGSRGLRGLKHVLLGSVAERTLRHAPCSVLTVKAEVG